MKLDAGKLHRLELQTFIWSVNLVFLKEDVVLLDITFPPYDSGPSVYFRSYVG